MKQPIYLDYSATTPVDPRVAEKMIPYLTEHFGNPASRSHAFGWEAEEAVEEAREQVAALVHCDPKELVWTSGATESINLALKGAAHFYKDKGKHLDHGEDRAQGDARHHARARAPTASRSPTSTSSPTACSTSKQFKAALRPDTILVSVMFVNNEIGVIQDIPAIGEICRARGIIFHVDAAQATGKVADRPASAEGRPDVASRRTRPTARRASARCTCAASRACASRRRCTAAATSAACAPARCRRTRSSAWARRSAWRELEMAAENERIRDAARPAAAPA